MLQGEGKRYVDNLPAAFMLQLPLGSVRSSFTEFSSSMHVKYQSLSLKLRSLAISFHKATEYPVKSAGSRPAHDTCAAVQPSSPTTMILLGGYLESTWGDSKGTVHQCTGIQDVLSRQQGYAAPDYQTWAVHCIRRAVVGARCLVYKLKQSHSGQQAGECLMAEVYNMQKCT